ncbi:MAG TPA: DEAD/DEAH box helicase family protein [Bacilli bacterium]|nr:DEAD/DEAH box helicase family protein [Bacilli bacterium]HPL55753.1 DEAD/DEAH box helicase family protein [Bacilli bacterium]
MELKNYQEKVLKDLDLYIDNILDTRNAARAYDKLWKDKGVRVGGTDGIQLYNDTIPGVPCVCFKVPTGGGKTILGCAAIKHIFDAMQGQKQVVLWLVPWDTILTQTYDNLKNPNHFYRERLNRDFASKVEIYTKKQALTGANFNPSAISEQLSIIVMSFDSLRASNKEDRKVYEENSNLMPFVHTFNDRRNMIQDVDDSALMQILNRLRPVVIIDESHNAKSDLSKEMIQNLNPSFVIELTATPKKDSNIISIVSAGELKEENMVKLPVIAYNRPSINRVIVESLDLRNSLEKAAKYERQTFGAPFIRPIVLFQAQPRGEEDSVTFDRMKQNLIDLGIPENQIAIKTASKNELNGIDLMSEDCQIRYIITINALKEGWDCPFAYILASISNRTSSVDVEQILGRVLRQPYQKQYSNKILNMSYVLTSSNDFQTTLDNILVGLNSAGFSKTDMRTVRTNSLDNLYEEKVDESAEQGSIFDGITSGGEDIDVDIFGVDSVKAEISSRSTEISNDSERETIGGIYSSNENVEKMLTQAEAKNDEYEAEVEINEREGTANIPEEVRQFSNVFLVKNEFKEEIKNELKLPIFCFKKKGTLFSDDSAIYDVDTEFLNDGFNLSTVAVPQHLTTSVEGIFKVDVESSADGDVIKKTILNRDDSEEFKRQLNLIPESSRVKSCEAKLISDLNGKFDNIPYVDLINFVKRIMATFTTEDDIQALQNNIYAISQRIKDYINEKLVDYRYSNFKSKLVANEIFTEYRYQLKLSITCPLHTNEYLRTLYTEEENKVNSLEQKFMIKVSSLENIKWWHRNIERRGFAINGYLNHYPDFVLETKSGVIVLIETKGEHLDGDDSKKKLELGQLWSNNSIPGKYKYFMAFDKTPLNENGSDLLDNIVDLISRL